MDQFKKILIISLWIAIVLTLAISSRYKWPEQRELSRKIVHIGIGPLIPFAWWLQISSSLAITASLAITVGLVINKRWKLIAAIEDVKRQSYGTVAYGFSISLLLILFWDKQPAAVCAAVMVMAFGDGLAGLIGRQINSRSWNIFDQRKSIAGTTTMTLVTVLVISFTQGIILHEIYPQSIFIITAFAVILEQISKWGIDNLTVPLGVAYSWIWTTNF